MTPRRASSKLVGTLEPLAAGRVLAHELTRERDKRHLRRKRRAMYKGRGDAIDDGDPPPIEILDCGRLFKNDWHDVDVALFDATRCAETNH